MIPNFPGVGFLTRGMGAALVKLANTDPNDDVVTASATEELLILVEIANHICDGSLILQKEQREMAKMGLPPPQPQPQPEYQQKSLSLSSRLVSQNLPQVRYCNCLTPPNFGRKLISRSLSVAPHICPSAFLVVCCLT